MKKIVSLVAFGILLASAAVAQVSQDVLKQMSFGIRASFGASMLNITESSKRELGNDMSSAVSELTGAPASYSVENEAVGVGEFALWGNYSFPEIPALGIQGEIGFLNNGTEISGESKSYVFGTGTVSAEFKDKISYTTMELPVLVTYTVNKDGFFEFIPHGGLYLSFPLGKCKEEYDLTIKAAGKTFKTDGEEKHKINNFALIGMAIGADFALNFTKTSALIFNTRYMADFNKLKIDGDEVARRSVFLLSIGYRYTVR